MGEDFLRAAPETSARGRSVEATQSSRNNKVVVVVVVIVVQMTVEMSQTLTKRPTSSKEKIKDNKRMCFVLI